MDNNRKLISTGSPFEKQAGYSRAMVKGDWCFVSGTTGYDYDIMQMPDSVEAQARNIFSTISSTLTDAGFDMGDIVRAHYMVTDEGYIDELFGVTGEIFAKIRPAATLIICDLLKPEIKIEIEVTAFRG